VPEVVRASGKASRGVLAARTSLPRPTVLRIGATLEAWRWLFRRGSDGSYRPDSAFPQGAGMPNPTCWRWQIGASAPEFDNRSGG
jgi:hypothetical protein